jgi:anti-sigma B factor antagonist
LNKHHLCGPTGDWKWNSRPRESRIHTVVIFFRNPPDTLLVMEKEPFAFQVLPGHEKSTRILRLTGPLIIQEVFELQSLLIRDYTPVTIFDLSGVPYMDSTGMGVIINYYVGATRRGCKTIVAGTCNRVHELFTLTHVDTIIPMTATVEEAESLV